MANREPAQRHAGRRNNDQRYDEFHETLAAPVPNQAYRSDIDLIDSRPAVLEQVISFVAALLNFFLIARFFVSIFTADRANPLVNFLDTVTDWLVMPFQALLGQPPTTFGGRIDIPSLAAIIAVTLIAGLLVRIARPARV